MLDLYQQVPYPNELLPYSLSEITVSNNFPDYMYHFHADCEFIFVEGGSGRFHIDTLKFDSKPGDIILISPNVMHSIHPINGRSHRFQLFNMHLDLIGLSIDDYTSIRYLKPLQNGITTFVPRIRPADTNYNTIKDILMDIFICAESRPPYHSFLMKAKLNELFYQLNRSGYITTRKPQTTAYRREERIRKTIDYVNNNYAQNLTVQDMADVSGYSLSHFMLFFKEYVGTSANDYLVHLRLKKAEEQVRETDLSITEIAHRCGFNNISNFNRQFKNFFHTTPIAMRRDHQRHTNSNLKP